MSVLACNRNSCPNVMCTRLSEEYGYICDSCFAEAEVAFREGKEVDYPTFMESPPGTYYDHKMPSDVFVHTGN